MMTILHKITAFLIVASFVFSGEVLARNNRIDDRNRTSSITARKRIPTAIARKSSSAARKKVSTGVTRRPSTSVTKATPVRPQRKIAARKAPIQTSPKARAISRARTQTRTKPVTINVSENKKVVTPKAKASPAPRTVKNIKTVEPVKKAQPTLVIKKRTTSSKSPKVYTINMRNLPDDMKDVRKIYGFNKEEIKATPAELRKWLADLQVHENKMVGATQKYRETFQSIGYNGGNANLPLKLAHLVNLPFGQDLINEMQHADPSFNKNDLAKTHYVPQSKITRLLDWIQQMENSSKGITEKTRNFLRSKYGFKS